MDVVLAYLEVVSCWFYGLCGERAQLDLIGESLLSWREEGKKGRVYGPLPATPCLYGCEIEIERIGLLMNCSLERAY